MTRIYGLSDVWSRGAGRVPGMRLTRSAAEWILGRPLSGWDAGDHVDVEPVSTQAQLAGVRRSLAATGLLTDLRGDLGLVTRAVSGVGETLTAVSVGERVPEPPIGLLQVTRRIVSDGPDGPDQPMLLDLEVEIGEIAVSPAMRGRGHGKLLGVALARTIVGDVRALIAGAGAAGDRIDLCIALAGVSPSRAGDRVLLSSLRVLEQGLEMLDPGDDRVVAGLRLSISEIEFAEDVTVQRGSLLSAA